ncbi:putative glutamyl-tRNA(Gln) amidotransferase subunit B-like protein [Leptotrombidium deliense]|uniref:Glutamyl-tRNA(Gln) amidotransferase subunit B, mitochondrial n=1 Tax=Leptotrombidium deliense TaxID=299467 RepID=A0A443SI17_9ACAR|nr:putative glutamyl-tRNA(Gln) amidotransferase subunit B-like protein [Leptotrombidium deliense]
MFAKSLTFGVFKSLKNTWQTFKILRRHVNSNALMGKKVDLKDWRTVVGLEIHCQIDSNSKLFSRAATNYYSAPNTNVSFFDCALPGTLPVLNKRCVEAAIISGLALNCAIAKQCTFDRKHYFYADLPSGYQITQYRQPIAKDGYIDYIVSNGHNDLNSYTKRVPLKQIQLEMDSGKSMRDTEFNRSLVDLNRAGVGLMEFVFDPVINSPDEAASLVRELSLILKRVGTCSCKMEEGALRVDVNISVHKPGDQLGTRCEIKNLNSLRSVVHVIEYETIRQINVIESGGDVVNETRAFDRKSGQTVPMRDKEVMQDYRFMPEPNLPPIVIKESRNGECENNPNVFFLEDVQKLIPRLPNEERQRLKDDYDLSPHNVYKLVEDEASVELFEKLMSEKITRDANRVAQFLLFDLSKVLDDHKMKLNNCTLSTSSIGECFDLMSSNVITTATACDVLNILIQGDSRTPTDIVNSNRWHSASEIEKHDICSHTVKVKKYWADRYQKKGQHFALGKLVSYATNYAENRISSEDAERIFNEMLQPPKKEDNI